MANRTDTFTTQIFLNDSQAKNKISQLEKDIKRLREEQIQAANAGNWDKFKEVKKDLKDATKEFNAMQTSSQKISHVLNNLSGASIKDIRQTIRAINKELNSGTIERGSKQWNFLNEQLKKCKAEIQSINQESSKTQSTWSKIVGFFNVNWGAITQGIAAITGLSVTIRKCTNDYAAMEDVMANTRKYTGMTDEQVRALNEDFKGMDTRTSREQLNDFAGAAGRLGITSKKTVEEFVDAADKISVALGDDLGDGAVDQIGKLAMAFGDDKTLGLRGAMLATGSAVNELAQNSAASAGYLVDFTARLAGVGKQAGMTQQQIMAMGSVLDSSMQQDETSATAISQLITKMSQDPAKFAKLAGKSIKEFSGLVKNDMNEALLQFFDAMKSKGGFSELAPMFEGMGLSGTRAVGVLSVMADKLNDIRSAQETANRAYFTGTSVVKEFNIQNTTVQAQLEKAKKEFQELTIELGGKLLPVARKAISTTSASVRILSQATNFIISHRRTLIALAASITALTIAVNISTIAFRIHYAAIVIGETVVKAYKTVVTTLKAALLALRLAWIAATQGTEAYTAALQANKIASATNPWTALATVILTVAGALVTLVAAFKDGEESAQKASDATNTFIQTQKAMSDVNKEANDNTAEEITKLKMLYGTLKDDNAQYSAKQNALKQIKQMVPSYHGALSKEGKLINDNVQVLKQYCDNLIVAAKAQAAFNKMVELQANNMQHQDLLTGRTNNQAWVKSQLAKYGYNPDTDVLTEDRNGMRIAKNVNGKWQYVNVAIKDWNTVRDLNELYKYNNQRIKEETAAINTNNAVMKNLEATVKADASKALQGGNNGNDGGNGGRNGGGNGGETTTTSSPSPSRGGHTDTNNDRSQRMQKEIDDAKKLNESLQAINLTRYYKGEIDYREYTKEMQRLAVDAINKEIEIRKKYGDTSKSMDLELAKALSEQKKAQIKEDEKQLEQEYKKQKINVQLEYYNPDSDKYQDQDAIDEELYKKEIEFLQKKKNLQVKGSEEYYDIDEQIEEEELQHKLARRESWEKKYKALKEQYSKMSFSEQEKQELEGLDALGLKEMGKTEEYEQLKMAIKLKYAKMAAEQTKKAENEEIISTARSRAGIDDTNGQEGNDDIFSVVGEVMGMKATEEQLQQMRQDGLINEQQYLDAKEQLHKNFWDNLPKMAQAAYNTISQFMDGMSSYYSAQSEYEVALTQKKYEKLIDKAGNNSSKQKKLQEKQEKEIAKIKTKYNRKQVKIQIAQAIAQTAVAALNAYASAAATPVVGHILAPIAAGIATAAGMIQVAAIKKQAQAQEAGYYEGGFTGGSSYRREVGVVHQGEFVANHVAVNNPQLLPAFRLIDQAQRNNTVGSLTASEVSQSMGVGGATVVSAPSVIVNQDNSDIAGTLLQARDTIERLGALLEDGVNAVVTIDGPNGLDKQYRRFKRLKENV